MISHSIPSLHAPVRQPLFPSHECGQSYAEKTLAACVAAEKKDIMIITEVLIYKAPNHFCTDYPKPIHEHTCIHTQAPAHTSILTIQNFIYTHTHTGTCTHKHTDYTKFYLHTHTHTHVHVHTHKHAHTHITDFHTGHHRWIRTDITEYHWGDSAVV